MALSPNGKIVASGCQDGTVRLWDINTGKVIKKWTEHTSIVQSICWSPDGGRVVSGSYDGMARVWDVESRQTTLRPLNTGQGNIVFAVCYSPDGTMIATGTDMLNVWDANTGKLLAELKGAALCLAWTSDGKTLISASVNKIRKFDTATWIEIAVLDGHKKVNAISLSPNECILASVSDDQTLRLWNFESNKPIGPPFHLEASVRSTAFSGDGKFLATGCNDKHVFTWDISGIVKEAGFEDLLSNNVNIVNKPVLYPDANKRRRAPQIEGIRRLPPGFFDDFSTSRSHHTEAPHQPTHWRRRSNPRGATEHDTQSRINPVSWAQNFVSGMLRRSNIRLHGPPIVDVPLTAGKPRDYHARGKKTTKSSRPSNPHTVQQLSGATQNNQSSLQQPPATATTSTTLPAVTGTAVATGTISRPDITIRQAGWRARFMLWVCCVPIQSTEGQH